jgi:hypothetical protein
MDDEKRITRLFGLTLGGLFAISLEMRSIEPRNRGMKLEHSTKSLIRAQCIPGSARAQFFPPHRLVSWQR